MNQTSATLPVNRETLRQILDFLPYPLVIAQEVQKKVVHIYFNKQFTMEIGYSIAEIPSLTEWFEQAYPDEEYRRTIQTSWSKLMQEAQAKGENFVMTKARITTKHGDEKWFEVKTSLFYEGYQLVSFVNLDDLITKDETLERTNENKNRMLSILSHDLRSSMLNLHSLSNLAINHSLSSDEFSSLARKVREKSSQAIELLDTTMQWTKSNFESIHPRLQLVNLQSTVENILALDTTHKEKNLEIKQYLEIPYIIYSDQGIVTIVIRNLISNAIKFTPTDSKIELASWTDEAGYHFMIKDYGLGMDKDTIAAVLSDRYSPSVGTLREQGSGIGLTLCRELLKKINATLSIKGNHPKGTEVQILFPSNLS